MKILALEANPGERVSYVRGGVLHFLRTTSKGAIHERRTSGTEEL
jgi:hypothetical protein